MKIGISGIFLKYPTSGLGQLLIHQLKALAEIDARNEYLLLGAPSTPWHNVVGSRSSIQVAPVPAFAARWGNIEQMAWEQFSGPAAARRAGVDLFHIPYYAPPLITRGPTIITIADVIQLRSYLYRNGVPARRRLYLDLIARAARKAALILTLSQHAKQDIVETLRISPARIRVIYPAAGDTLAPVTDVAVLAETRARYGLGERYILYLGGLDRRKNVLHLVRAFAALYRRAGDPDLQLFIAGDPEKQRGPLYPDPRPLAAQLGITKQITYRFVEEADKAAIYSGASLFVFPSLYEGFGLPPLEAMQCGAPVVCSNATSLPEVVGDAAISLDPDDTSAWVEAMERFLADDNLKATMQARGLQQAAHFTWRKTARETLAAYEEVAAQGRYRKQLNSQLT
jgi:glycosyltransferase involved in cell wall biosynthesis